MLVPSRGHPRLAAALAQSIADTATAHGVELLFYLDADDPDLGEYRQRIAPYKFAAITVGDRLTVGRALNILAAEARGDLLMLGSDDLFCQSVGWDRVLRKEASRFADGVYVLWANDNGQQLAGRPVVSRRWFETLGYFTPEHFEFGGSAIWLAEIAGKLDRLHYAANAMIEHHHPHGGGGDARDSDLQRIERNDQAQRDANAYATLARERVDAADKLRKLIKGTPPPVAPPVKPQPAKAMPSKIVTPPKRGKPGAGIPKIFNFFWIGGDLPDFAEFLIGKWRGFNPDYEIKLHGEEVLRPEYQPMYDMVGSPSQKVDVLKWCALQTYGGWTIDADTVPLHPMSMFTDKIDKAAKFVAINVPPADEKPGYERCDMGLIGATTDSRIWAAVNWYMAGNVDMTPWERRGTKGGACAMEWLLANVPHLMTRFPANTYCPYGCKGVDRPWMEKGGRFWKAYRAGGDTAAMLAEYNAAFNNPLAWHIWNRAIR